MFKNKKESFRRYMKEYDLMKRNSKQKIEDGVSVTSEQSWGNYFETVLLSSSWFVFVLRNVMFFLYFLIAIGISAVAPELLMGLDNIVRIFICVFLLIRFNPYRGEITYTKTDTIIVFNATILLIFSQGLTAAISGVLQNIRYFYNILNTLV